MNNDKLTLLIFTLALSIVLLPKTVYSFAKKRLTQPKLSIEIVLSDESFAKKKWKTADTENGEPLYVYEIFWHYKLRIKHHSSYIAYEPKISSNVYLPYYSHMHPIVKKIIVPSETIETKGYYTRLEKCKKDRHTDLEKLPKEFDNIKLLLSYQNQDKISFYTVFDFKHRINSTTRTQPAEFV